MEYTTQDNVELENDVQFESGSVILPEQFQKPFADKANDLLTILRDLHRQGKDVDETTDPEVFLKILDAQDDIMVILSEVIDYQQKLIDESKSIH